MDKMLVSAATCAVALSAATLSAAVPGPGTLIAHRGESVDAPENTLPAYRTAVERGFGFECDIYLSRDGRVFTFHDRNLTRTTGGANTNMCADVTWDEISRLDVGGWGRWKGSRFEGTRPALLEEVLELARDGRWIYVEVKTGPEIVPFVKKVFESQSKATPRNTLFISFNADSCRELKRTMPEFRVYWLTFSRLKGGDGVRHGITPEYVIGKCRELGVDGVDSHYDPEVVTAEFIKTVHDAGFGFHVWTVDDLADTVTAFSRGAETVTTNCAKKQSDAWFLAKEMIGNGK